MEFTPFIISDQRCAIYPGFSVVALFSIQYPPAHTFIPIIAIIQDSPFIGLNCISRTTRSHLRRLADAQCPQTVKRGVYILIVCPPVSSMGGLCTANIRRQAHFDPFFCNSFSILQLLRTRSSSRSPNHSCSAALFLQFTVRQSDEFG